MPLQCAAESPSAIAMFLATPQNLARKPENTTAVGHEELNLPAVQWKAAYARFAGIATGALIELVLAVAPPGEHWRVFSTDEFKPPEDPENWQLENGGATQRLLVEPHPDLLSVQQLLAILGDIGPERLYAPANGCYHTPTHYCGK